MNDHRFCCSRLTALILSGIAFSVSSPAMAESIEMAFSAPKSIESDRDWSISGSVLGAEDMASAQCRYRSEATGKWVTVPMTSPDTDHFQARIPGDDIVPPYIEFYCVGKDYYGGKFNILASPSSPERLKVVKKDSQKEAAAPAPAPVSAPKEETEETKDGEEASTDADSAADAAFDEEPMEIVQDSEPTESGPRETSIEPVSHAESFVKEMPTEDLAPDGKVDDLTGGLPPDSELSSNKDIQNRYGQIEAADFSQDDSGMDDGQVSLASRKAESVKLAPAITSSISGEQIRSMGMMMLPDVLKSIPGLDMSRDVQGFHRIAVRGIMDEGSILVMYDGHRLNSSYDAKPMLGLTTDNLEHVEILRGPGSAVHGTGATLGTINVVSRRETGISGSVMGGTEGTAAAHLSGGVRFGSSDWYLYGDASYRRTDGYREKINQDSLSKTMEIMGQKREDEPAGITDDHSQFVNAGLELRRSAPGGGTTRIFGRFLYEDRGALSGLFDVVGADSELTWMAILADITHRQPFDIGTLTARLYFDHQSVDRLFQVAPKNYSLKEGVIAVDGLFEETKFSTQNIGFDVAMDFNLGKSNQLTVGITGEMQRLPTYSYGLNYTGDQLNEGGAILSPYIAPLQTYSEIKNRLVGAVVLQDFWKLHRTFSLIAGIRLDVTQLPDSVERGGEIVPDGTRFVPSFNPRVGLVWAPAHNWTLKLLYGRAFRAPTMQELSERIPETDLTQGRSEGNPMLSPSTVDTVEAAIETTLPVGMSRLRLRADGFFNYFSDPIMAVDSTGNISPLENRDLGVRVYGAEGEIRFEVSGSRAYTFINCSWFRAEDLAAYDGFQYLTNVPQIRFNWGTLLPLGPYLNFSLLAQYGSERRNNARSILEAQRSYTIPAYILVGAQLSTQRIANHFEFALTLRNVFDFKTFDEVPRPDSARMPGLLPREGFGAFLSARVFY